MDAALANLFVWASRQAGTATPPDARSAALRFLHKRLDTLPATHGHFRANARLPIPCGTNSDLEVSLLSSDDHLAIELDTPSDLANPDSYRRARRQDLLLQSAGYRILRFFAPDIPARLPSILDAILRFVSPTLPPSTPN